MIKVDDIQITMPDGVVLAARLWLPATTPAPAIFEMLPYRLSDFRSDRDDRWYRFLAGNGYVGVRLDVRGSGNSEGVFADEYSSAELDDGEYVINWIARQNWCSGAVGMMGISYSGFNSIQLAERAIPALKAVVVAGFVTDRFQQDVHRVGGAIHDVGLFWSQMITTLNAMPPDPLIAGDDWYARWLKRLDRQVPTLPVWLAQQNHGPYWRRGSVGVDLEKMTCPVYAVSGWADRYPDGSWDVAKRYRGPHKVLIGPWEHAWPQEAGIGPQLDFAPEVVRWFDHWLRGIDDGIMEEPSVTVWMKDSTRDTGGTWLAISDLGTPQPSMEFFLSEHRLHVHATPMARDMSIHSPLETGMAGGVSAPLLPGRSDYPGDQREDDGRSTLFDSAPLTDAFGLLGETTLEVVLRSSHPVAMLAARLCDVDQNGTSKLIAIGILQLPRGAGAVPVPLPVDQPSRFTLRFPVASYTVPAGHRLRLALSQHYWPWAWPAPYDATLTLCAGERMVLRLPPPTSTGTPAEAALFQRPAPVVKQGTWTALAGDAGNARSFVTDLSTQICTRESRLNLSNEPHNARGMRFDFTIHESSSLHKVDPLLTAYVCKSDFSLTRDAWRCQVRTHTEITCDLTQFHVTLLMSAYAQDELVFQHEWRHAIARELI